MDWQRWTFRFLDTCFFRDGLPFNMGEGGYTVTNSFFPPLMTTLQGAVRTALAAELGWNPGRDDRWPAELGGPDDLGSIRLRGPYLLKDGRPLFAAPLNLLARKVREEAGIQKKYTFAKLKPGPEVQCDLGRVRLPVPDDSQQGAATPQNLFLTRSGLEAVLQGKLPGNGDIREKNQLWNEEPRTGLERDDTKRTAIDGRLYNCTHIRPERGVEVAVYVAGVPSGWNIRKSLIAGLGGEGRLAEVKVEAPCSADIMPAPALPQPAEDRKVRFTVTLVTPGYYNDPRLAVRHGPPGVPGCCVSACIGKAVRAGGWDLARQEPRPLTSLLPAGSVWFYEAEADDLNKVAALHGQCLGDQTAFGFGQVAIGKWKEEI
ncbi:MAG: type III-B CRISPR module-associated protein Cmr3 [Pelotomaculum sp.]|nr:type III-B CRISPR module-associated protein Cmr3 [Pelotomaculum sp.]